MYPSPATGPGWWSAATGRGRPAAGGSDSTDRRRGSLAPRGLIPFLCRGVDVGLSHHIRPRKLDMQRQLLVVGAGGVGSGAHGLPDNRIVVDVEAGFGEEEMIREARGSRQIVGHAAVGVKSGSNRGVVGLF